MNYLRIKETCLYARDLEAIKRFYHNVLGLPVISHVDDKHIFFRAGESVLLCFNPDDSRNKKSPPAHFASGKLHFAFEVHEEDYEAEKRRLDAAGVKIIDEVTWPSGKRSFYFEDPAGNVLEIVPENGIWD